MCMAGVTGSDLKKRIERIMTRRTGRQLDFGRKLLLAAAGIAAVAGPIAFGVANAPAIRAQSPAKTAAQAFEVASVKPNNSDDHRVMFKMTPGGRVEINNASAKMLIVMSYNLKPNQLSGGPSWLESAKYDITATAPEGPDDPERTNLMMQTLLADRFKLAIHRETKDMPIYELVTGKNGPKLKASAEAAGTHMGQFRIGHGQMDLTSVSIADFADNLSRIVGRNVYDKTGLTGTYDIKLEWTPDENENPMLKPHTDGNEGGTAPVAEAGPSLSDALQEKLGLKLQAAKGPVEIVVIDHIEKAFRTTRGDWMGGSHESLVVLLAWPLLPSNTLRGAEHRGVVEFNGLPLPGATVSVSRDGQKFAAISNEQGAYVFPDLADGTWKIQIEMLCFATIVQDVAAANGGPVVTWELKLLPLDQIKAAAVPMAALPRPAPVAPAQPSAPASAPAAAPARDELAEQAADGLLVNGTESNGASTPFALAPAFGNSRLGSGNLLTGGIGVILENSALDARPFSLTGQDTPQLSYNHVRAVATLGGVMKIPHIMPRGPNFFVAYQWTRNRDAVTQDGLMPDALMRLGQFSGADQAFDVPQSRISPQARALLSYYPLPNFGGSSSYNYQIPTIDVVHQDALQSRLNKTIDTHNQLYGGFAFQSTRSDTPNLFGFLDTSDVLGINTNVHWEHTFRPRLYGNLGYQFSRQAVRTTPFFEYRENVSGDAAGIFGQQFRMP